MFNVDKIIEASNPSRYGSMIQYHDDQECLQILKKELENVILTVPEKDISRLLLYYSNSQNSPNRETSTTAHSLCIAALLKKFPTFNNADTIRKAFSLCLQNGGEFGALVLLKNHHHLLDNESILSIIKFGQLELLHKALQLPTIKEMIRNEDTSKGITFAECAIMTHNYNMIAELANCDVNFDRALAIYGPKLQTLKPPLFGRSTHDAKFQHIVSTKLNDQKTMGNAMENLVDAINKGVYDKESLSLMAKQPKFKDRLFDYIIACQPEYIKKTLTDAITEGHPLNTIFLTPTGLGLNNPNASHGHMLKVLNKLKEVESENQNVALRPYSYSFLSNLPTSAPSEIETVLYDDVKKKMTSSLTPGHR